jgi:hypothetical protein
MTRTDDNRRPVRVLPPTEVAGAPKPPATVQAADRFNRTLAGARRTEAPAEKFRPAAEPRTERSPGAERAPHARVNLPLPDDGDTPELPRIDTAGPAGGAGAALPQDTAQPHAPQPRQPAVEAAGLDDTGRWAEDAAQKVATLCTRADASFAHWSVILPMDAQALPETDLMLSMSPHGLSLRFRTQSSLSSQLINTHKPRLQALLGRTRGLPRDIDIEVT